MFSFSVSLDWPDCGLAFKGVEAIIFPKKFLEVDTREYDFLTEVRLLLRRPFLEEDTREYDFLTGVRLLLRMPFPELSLRD